MNPLESLVKKDSLKQAFLDYQIVTKQTLQTWLSDTGATGATPLGLIWALDINHPSWKASETRTFPILAERLALEEQQTGTEALYIPCPGYADAQPILQFTTYNSSIPPQHQRERAFLVPSKPHPTFLILNIDPWNKNNSQVSDEFWRKKAYDTGIQIPADTTTLHGFTHLAEAIACTKQKHWNLLPVTPQVQNILENQRINPYYETPTHIYAWNVTDLPELELKKKITYYESFFFKKLRVAPPLYSSFGRELKTPPPQPSTSDDIKTIWQNFLIKCISEYHSDIHVSPNIDGAIAIASRGSGLVRPRFMIPTSQRDIFYKAIMHGTGLDALKDPQIPRDARGTLKNPALRRNVDFRYSLQPGPPPSYWPKVVMRILDPANLKSDVFKLATYFPEDIQSWKRILALNKGMVLMTGPTGSGKSMTLYAILQSWHASNPGLVFQTIEDPIEFLLGPWLHQSEVIHGHQATWARLIRQNLRNDIDGLMCGEIRDAETAELTTQFSLSGHILLSTIHAESAYHVPNRLHDMGANTNTLSRSLNASIAQRLVAFSCPKCQKPLSTQEKLQCSQYGAPSSILDKLVNNTGCPHCKYEGINGRTAIQEFAFFDSDAERNLIRDPNPEKIQAAMQAKGLKTLAQKAWELAAKQLIPASQALDIADFSPGNSQPPTPTAS